MPVWVRSGGVWKNVEPPAVKASGTWKTVTGVSVKESGVWKSAYAPSNQIPSGIIIPYIGAGTPTGWTAWANANGYYIVAAGLGYSVGSKGGGTTLALSGNTGSAGAHSGGSTFSVATAQSGITVRIGNTSEGNHNHSASTSLTGIEPKYREYKLIRSGGEESQFPANGVVLSTVSLALTNIHNTVDAFLKASANSGATGGSMTHAVPSFSTSQALNHSHGSLESFQSGTTYTFNRYNAAGAHSHTLSGTATLSPKQAYLAAWTDTAASFNPLPGCIVFYEGSSAPEGWYLCDGNNGTVDLRRHFIRIGTTGNAGNKSGDNTATTGSLTTSTDGAHNHQGGTVKSDFTLSNAAYHSNNLGGHSHSSVVLTGSYEPPYYALSLICKA